MKLIRVFILAVALATVPALAATATMTQSEVEEALTCQCGCGLTVRNCNHTQCGFAIPVRADIAASLAKGESGEDIIARYVAEYGEKVLSSPVAEGFNIMAWVGPYLSIILGGLGIGFTIRRWARKGGEAEVPVAALSAQETAELKRNRGRLEDELEKMDQ